MNRLRRIVNHCPDCAFRSDGLYAVCERHLTLVGRNDRYRLTPNQFALLKLLVDHRGAIVTRGEIIKTIWGEGGNALSSKRSLDTLIHLTRNRIGAASDSMIIARGIGLFWEDNPSDHYTRRPIVGEYEYT